MAPRAVVPCYIVLGNLYEALQMTNRVHSGFEPAGAPRRILALALVLTGLLASLACTGAPPPSNTIAPTIAPAIKSASPSSVTPTPATSPTVAPPATTESKSEITEIPSETGTKGPATRIPEPTVQPATVSPAASATKTPSQPNTTDPRLTRAVQAISEALSKTRGLTFLEPVAPELITRPALIDYLAATIDEEDQEELAGTQELYWILGLLDPSIELYPLFLDLLGEQVLGLFNLETDELLVVADSLPLDGSGKITMAHELVHALQQQRFDAHRLVEESESNQDRELAMTALLEGDAQLSSTMYAAAHLSLSEILELLPNAEESSVQVFQSTPEVIQKTLLFPYQAGADFVSSAQQSPGIWRQVNQLYSRPPVSTEQILHPAKYAAGEDPIPVSLPTGASLIEEDWELVMEDVFGEFLLRTYLETGLPRPQSIRAASGWGGDRFRLLKDDSGRRLLVAVFLWDTSIDAGEFFESYRDFTDVEQQWESHAEDGNLMTWHAPGRSVLLELDGESTLIGIAPDPETLALIAKDFP